MTAIEERECRRTIQDFAVNIEIFEGITAADELNWHNLGSVYNVLRFAVLRACVSETRRSIGLVQLCRFHQTSAPSTHSKAISWVGAPGHETSEPAQTTRLATWWGGKECTISLSS